jgi:hypothetical protein
VHAPIMGGLEKGVNGPSGQVFPNCQASSPGSSLYEAMPGLRIIKRPRQQARLSRNESAAANSLKYCAFRF